MKAKGDRNCGNCAYQQLFKYSSLDKKQMMRCWEHPDVCDHAFVQTEKEGKKYVCCEHRTKEERDEELYREARFDYAIYKRRIKELETKWPVLAMMDWEAYLNQSNDDADENEE